MSAQEVVAAHLARVDAVKPRVNAITRLNPAAMAEAAEIDRAVADGAILPLAGVPVTIKDNIDVAGQTTPNGVPALNQTAASVDAPSVASLRAAGAVVFGRTNTPEFSWRWHTDNLLFGPTLNPWNPALTPGGSRAGRPQRWQQDLDA